MPADIDDAAHAVAAEIVTYLRTHPAAADTVEGVARWWLRQRPPVDTVSRAMALLITRGTVEKHTLPEGTVVYRGRGQARPPGRARDRDR